MTTRLLDWLNRRGKALAIRLVRWTGKSPELIHPKHLVEQPWNDWYLAGLGPGDWVLDVGCGTGTHARRALRTGASVAAVDIDPAVIPRVWLPTGIWFDQADACKTIPWPDEFFTCVLALDVIEHVEDRQGMLREIRRVLAPDGTLCIAAPNRETAWRRRLRRAGLFAYSDPDNRIEYTEGEFLEELQQGGFTPLSVTPTVYDTPWAGLIDCIGGLSLGLYRRLQAWKRAVALRHPEEATGFCVVARPA